MAYGRWQPYVDAEPARQHIRRLQAAGIGRRRIAELAGVADQTINSILGRRPGRNPSKRLRPQVVAAILAIAASPTALADGKHVDATPTRRRIEALMAIGWPIAEQARRLGRSPANFAKVAHGRLVEVGTARQVSDLYERMSNSIPPPSRTKTLVLGYARRHGFAVPAAWDDIDDPAAVPHKPDQPDHLADEVVVEMALKQQWPLSRIERRIDRAAVVTELVGTGIALSTVAARLKTSIPVVAKLLAECAA